MYIMLSDQQSVGLNTFFCMVCLIAAWNCLPLIEGFIRLQLSFITRDKPKRMFCYAICGEEDAFHFGGSFFIGIIYLVLNLVVAYPLVGIVCASYISFMLLSRLAVDTNKMVKEHINNKEIHK